MRARNESGVAEVEQLWAEKRSREEELQRLEQEMEQERHMADNLVAAMKPELRDR